MRGMPSARAYSEAHWKTTSSGGPKVPLAKVMSLEMSTRSRPPGDVVFQRASEYARALGIPRIYMAANSGARLGVSDAVKRCFRVHFVDASDPAKGVQYLWLSAKDKERRQI